MRTEFVTGDGIVVPHEAAYTCLADGGIAVEETATLPDELTDLARIGTVLEVVSDPEDLRWFGSGPHETYPDRKRGGLVGAGGRPSRTSTSRTSARRRTAATPTCAGSS